MLCSKRDAVRASMCVRGATVSTGAHVAHAAAEILSNARGSSL